MIFPQAGRCGRHGGASSRSLVFPASQVVLAGSTAIRPRPRAILCQIASATNPKLTLLNKGPERVGDQFGVAVRFFFSCL